MSSKRKQEDATRRNLQFGRNLDWNLLKFFHEIAEARSVTRAASELSRKQPALSLALRRLEERLGVTLCQRGPTGFELTDEGRVLADTCRGFADAIRELPSRLAHIEAEVKGTSAGHAGEQPGRPGPGRCDSWLSCELPRGRDHRRGGCVDRGGECAHAASDRRRHLRPRASSGRSSPTCTSSPRCIGPTAAGRTRCSGAPWPSPSELAPEPFVLTGADEGDELTQFRLEHGLGRNIAGISAHLEEAKRLAILGIGLCFLPEGYAQPDVDGGRLWPLVSGSKVPRTEMFVVTDPQSPAHAARDRFIAEVVGRSARLG